MKKILWMFFFIDFEKAFYKVPHERLLHIFLGIASQEKF